MKKLFTAVAITLLIVGVGQAQERGARGGQRDPEEMINRIMENDTDDDGKLAEDEMPERMARMFGTADGDKDGFVTKEELKTMFASRMRGRGERGEGGRGGRGGDGGGPGGGRGGEGGGPGGMMRMLPIIVALDTDKNGELSKDEIENAVAALKTLDKNEDGKISMEEMMPPRPMRGAGGEGGRGGERGRDGGRGGDGQRPRRPASDDDGTP